MNWIHIVLSVVGIAVIILGLSFLTNFSNTYLFIFDLFQARNIKYFTFLFVIILFIILSYLYFKYKIQPKLNNTYISNKEFTDEKKDGDEPVNLYLFYTTWCPHCKNAWDPTNKSNKPWNELKEELIKRKNKINKKEIIVTEVDCEEEKSLAEQYKIEGYPTIKLVYNNKIYNYDAKPDKDQLIDFLNQVLQ